LVAGELGRVLGEGVDRVLKLRGEEAGGLGGRGLRVAAGGAVAAGVFVPLAWGKRRGRWKLCVLCGALANPGRAGGEQETEAGGEYEPGAPDR
jgi:hypothetical protein